MELQRRHCVRKDCENTFRVLPTSDIVHCSRYCRRMLAREKPLQGDHFREQIRQGKMAFDRARRFKRFRKMAQGKADKQIWHLMQIGMSSADIARELNRTWIPSPSGAPWYDRTVDAVLWRLRRNPPPKETPVTPDDNHVPEDDELDALDEGTPLPMPATEEPPKKKRPYTRRATVDPKPRAVEGKLPPYVRALLDSDKLTAEAKIEAIRLYDEVGA